MKACYSRLAAALAGVYLSINPLQSQASDWAERISIAGFGSAMYHRTDEAVPFNGPPGVGHDNQGSFSDTKMGLNINADINERFSFASQLFGSKEDNEYAIHVDWAFGALKLTDGLTLRTGKMKFPVGLVNEYVDVGYALPWLSAPVSFYSSAGAAENGPSVTREGYTGASLLWQLDLDDWALDFDLFGGEISLEDANVRKLSGLTVTANMDDELIIKLSTYQGTMHQVILEGADSGGTAWEQAKAMMQTGMEGTKHEVTTFGVKYDVNNILFMYEWADVTMGDLTAMDTTSWYTTLGYQMGKFLPTLTFENLTQGDGNGAFDDDQDIITLALRWDYMSNMSIKFEASQIKLNQGNGLFGYDANPSSDTTMMYGTGIDFVF